MQEQDQNELDQQGLEEDHRPAEEASQPTMADFVDTSDESDESSREYHDPLNDLLGDSEPEASAPDQAKPYLVFLDEAGQAKIDMAKDVLLGQSPKLKQYEPLNFLPLTPAQTEILFQRWPTDEGYDFPGTREESEIYFEQIRDATENHTNLNKLAFHAGAMWQQSVADDHNREMTMMLPNLDARKHLSAATRTAQRINKKLGIGRSLNVPLWNSGIWMTISAPMLSEELDFDRRQSLDRVLIGRTTYGEVFSNDGVITNRELVDFILEHTLEHSLSGVSTEELMNNITLPDFHLMVVGFAAAIHVNGYPFRQPCLSDPEKCVHVESGTLNIPKLSWVDRTKITDYQRRLMAKRGSKVTLQDLEKYREEIVSDKTGTLKIDGDMTVFFKTPTLAEHFDVGEAWIMDLTANADIKFGTKMSVDERNIHLIKSALATRLRSHSHWIEAIEEEIQTDQGVVTNRMTRGKGLERILNQLSGADDIVTAILDGIAAYQAKTINSMVGIPNYACPKCGAYHTDARGAINAIHPIDPVSVFFKTQRSRLKPFQTPAG